jgi:hypothetical protein
VGWNIWNIILDIAGAILSLLQLVGDAIDLDDYSSIAGNFAKLGLSIISIGFDVSEVSSFGFFVLFRCHGSCILLHFVFCSLIACFQMCLVLGLNDIID